MGINYFQFVKRLVRQRFLLHVGQIPNHAVHADEIDVAIGVKDDELFCRCRIAYVIYIYIAQQVCLIIGIHTVVFRVVTEMVAISKHEYARIGLHRLCSIEHGKGKHKIRESEVMTVIFSGERRFLRINDRPKHSFSSGA